MSDAVMEGEEDGTDGDRGINRHKEPPQGGFLFYRIKMPTGYKNKGFYNLCDRKFNLMSTINL